jgi:hypothetical protein
MNKTISDILHKRFQTTMIGALYEFEKSFGYLWGQDKPDDEELTNRQYEFLDIWEETRNKILNTGNGQLRKCLSELKQQNQEIKYNYNFNIKEEK